MTVWPSPALVQLREPDCVERVGLRTPRHLLHLAGVDEPDRDAARLQQVDKRAPVVGGRLDHDPPDPLPGQLLGERGDRVRRRLDVPDLGDAPAWDRDVRDACAHLSGGLGDIDRGHPLDDLLVLFGLDLDRLSAHRAPPPLDRTQRVAPGAPVREAEILTRVLVAQSVTLLVGPQRQTEVRSQDQGSVGVAGNPAPIFTPTVASRQGYGD